MNRLTDALAHICRSNVLQEKWLIAPSLRAGHQWLDSVTRSDEPVVNVRTTTLRGLVLDVAGPEMALRSLRLVSARGGAIIVDGILRGIQESSPTYLTKLTLTPSLSRSVYSSLNDLRLAGVDPENLDVESFIPREKGIEITSVITTYLAELKRLNLVDYAGAVELASGRLRESAAFFDQDALLLIPTDIECTAAELDLLSLIPSEKILKLPVDEQERMPEGCTSVRTDLDLLRWINNPAQAPDSPLNDGTVRIFRGVGEINEVREVFRRILSGGIHFDEVELLHTDTATYVPLIFETAVRLVPDYSGVEDLFVTFEEGIPARYSRPGRALAGWVAWQREDHLQSHLVRLIQEGLVSVPRSAEGKFGSAALAATLRSIGIGMGADRYVTQLDATVEGLKKQLADRKPDPEQDEPVDDVARRLSERLAITTCLQELVSQLLETGPDRAARIVDVLGSAGQFLEQTSHAASELDNYALRALVKEIRDMARYVDEQDGEVSLDPYDWLSSLPGETRVLGSGPRPGCIHVSSVHAGGHSLRPHTFIVGLDDGRFPGAGLQDPVMLDREREKLSDRLPTAAGRLDHAMEAFARLLARLRGTVTLSYSCRNVLDDREMFPSPFVLSAYRIASGEREGDYGNLLKWAGAAASFAPAIAADSTDAAEWWLSRLCTAGGIENRDEILTGRFPHLSRGREAMRQRLSPTFTVYDGRLNDPGVELDPTSPAGPPMSATRLETLGRCPLAYFFRYVLHLELPEDLTVDVQRWLDPLRFGTLLHEILYSFVTSTKGDHWPPRRDEDLPLLEDLVRTMTGNLRSEIPPPTEDAYVRQVNQLLEAAEVFLREEEAAEDRAPRFCEASIGLESYQHATEIDTRIPVKLRLADGKTIRIRGRLDRIDHAGPTDGEDFAVCDYKSGSASRYEHHDPFKQGRIVQHALYTAAVEARLKEKVSPGARVTEFAYFFPGVRDRGLRLTYAPEILSDWVSVVGNLCELAASGSFPATDNTDDCTFCDYLAICGDVAALTAASRSKMDLDLENKALKPMKELRSRE